MTRMQVIALIAGLGVAPALAEEIDWPAAVAEAAPEVVEFGPALTEVTGRDYPLRTRFRLPVNEAAAPLSSDFGDGEVWGTVLWSSPDGSPAELVQVFSVPVPGGEITARVQAILVAIDDQIAPALDMAEGAEVLGARRAELEDAAAVEWVARWQDPDAGGRIDRVVAILPDAAPEALVMVQRVWTAQVPVADVDALQETFAGQMLRSAAVLGWTGPDGSFVARD